MKMKNIAQLFVVLISLATNLAQAAEFISVGDKGRLITDSFFGLHLRYGTTKTPWPSVDFYSWRVITPETEWRGLQPSENKWNFSHLDKAVELGGKNNVEILLTLGQTPPWAASRPSELVPNGAGASSEPQKLSDWENYIRTVARRYKGKIKYYELWNEPYFREIDPYRAIAGFTGYAVQMVELGRIAKQVLHEEDPNAVLISPGFGAGFPGVPRIEQWFKAGGGSVTQALAYHFYLRPPELMGKLYSQLRAITVKYGYPSMPIFNTESGYYVQNPEHPVSPKYPGSNYVFAKVLTPEENGAYMIRAHLITAAAGLDRFYWYSWDILDMGLTRSYGQVQTSGSQAYGTMLRWLRNSVIKDCATENDKTWVCRLSRNGASAYVVWNSQGDEDFTIPTSMNVGEMETITSQVSQLNGKKVSIGISPILLRAKGVPWLP
jgi:hypothetical protein